MNSYSYENNLRMYCHEIYLPQIQIMKNRKWITVFILLVLALSATDSVYGQDWPEWRGSGRDGVGDVEHDMVDGHQAQGPQQSRQQVEIREGRSRDQGDKDAGHDGIGHVRQHGYDVETAHCVEDTDRDPGLNVPRHGEDIEHEGHGSD